PRPIHARRGATQVVTARVWRCVPAVCGAATYWVRSTASTVATVTRPAGRVVAIPHLPHARTVAGGVLWWGTVRDPRAVHSAPAAW
ncbi:hypothetical protein, partial [Chloroflexus sp.]|uniref:hypothetical protein n=1 Tax=Chloroflexus sp. TaxID=1904827 RepID=UPI002ACD4448